jgi:hypothetical protein
VISPRYAPAVCIALALALVPTIIHSYAGVVVTDTLATAAIPTTLAGYTSVPSTRDAGWGQRRFESYDWFERRYLLGSREVLLTVIRSYDLKKLYHHPELDVAYGAGYLRYDVHRTKEHPDVPVHLLSTDVDKVSTAVYALHYDGGFVEDPIAFQIRTAGALLFSGRKPMTLLFARDVGPTDGLTPEAYPSTQVLFAAIDAFVHPPTQVH